VVILNSTETFSKCKNLIHKFVWKVAQTYGLDYEELCSDGYYIFVDTLLRYDEKMGAFTTFLWHRLRGLADVYYRSNKDLLRIRYCDSDELDGLESPVMFDAFVQRLELQDSIRSDLSKDARIILSYVFANQDKKHTKNTIRKHLREKLHWSVKQVEISIQEIQTWWACYEIV
jgi:uncharacterized protein YlbG (UPF0298 family)